MQPSTDFASRYGHTSVTASDGLVYIFGGLFSKGTFTNELWRFSQDGVSCERVKSALRAPGTGENEPDNDEAQVSSNNDRETMKALQQNTGKKNALQNSGGKKVLAPPPRAYHSMVLSRADVGVVFGGAGANGAYFSDIWKIDLAMRKPVFDKVLTTTVPPGGGRCGHGAVYVDERDAMIVVGGSTATGDRSDCHVLCCQTWVWYDVQLPSLPTTLSYHTTLLRRETEEEMKRKQEEGGGAVASNRSSDGLVEVLVWGGRCGKVSQNRLLTIPVSAFFTVIDKVVLKKIKRKPQTAAAGKKTPNPAPMSASVLSSATGNSDGQIAKDTESTGWAEFYTQNPSAAPCPRWLHAMCLVAQNRLLVVAGGKRMLPFRGHTCELGDVLALDYLTRRWIRLDHVQNFRDSCALSISPFLVTHHYTRAQQQGSSSRKLDGSCRQTPLDRRSRSPMTGTPRLIATSQQPPPPLFLEDVKDKDSCSAPIVTFLTPNPTAIQAEKERTIMNTKGRSGSKHRSLMDVDSIADLLRDVRLLVIGGQSSLYEDECGAVNGSVPPAVAYVSSLATTTEDSAEYSGEYPSSSNVMLQQQHSTRGMGTSSSSPQNLSFRPDLLGAGGTIINPHRGGFSPYTLGLSGTSPSTDALNNSSMVSSSIMKMKAVSSLATEKTKKRCFFGHLFGVEVKRAPIVVGDFHNAIDEAQRFNFSKSHNSAYRNDIDDCAYAVSERVLEIKSARKFLVPWLGRVRERLAQRSHQKNWDFDGYSKRCYACDIRNITHVLEPCGHFIVCEVCAFGVLTCPLCDAPAKGATTGVKDRYDEVHKMFFASKNGPPPPEQEVWIRGPSTTITTSLLSPEKANSSSPTGPRVDVVPAAAGVRSPPGSNHGSPGNKMMTELVQQQKNNNYSYEHQRRDRDAADEGEKGRSSEVVSLHAEKDAQKDPMLEGKSYHDALSTMTTRSEENVMILESMCTAVPITQDVRKRAATCMGVRCVTANTTMKRKWQQQQKNAQSSGTTSISGIATSLVSTTADGSSLESPPQPGEGGEAIALRRPRANEGTCCSSDGSPYREKIHVEESLNSVNPATATHPTVSSKALLPQKERESPAKKAEKTKKSTVSLNAEENIPVDTGTASPRREMWRPPPPGYYPIPTHVSNKRNSIYAKKTMML